MKVTIFGLAGTGKTTAGKMLSETLGYERVSTGDMYRQMAEDHGMTLSQFQVLAEKDERYDRELDEVRIMNYGREHDNFVLDSRLAWHFIPDSFKIRLYCDFNERIKRIAGRENKDFETAKQETIHRESIISSTYKKMYGLENIDDPKNFDININTTKTSPKRVLEIINEFLETKNPAK